MSPTFSTWGFSVINIHRSRGSSPPCKWEPATRRTQQRPPERWFSNLGVWKLRGFASQNWYLQRPQSNHKVEIEPQSHVETGGGDDDDDDDDDPDNDNDDDDDDPDNDNDDDDDDDDDDAANDDDANDDGDDDDDGGSDSMILTVGLQNGNGGTPIHDVWCLLMMMMMMMMMEKKYAKSGWWLQWWHGCWEGQWWWC